jgi:plastocyanin
MKARRGSLSALIATTLLSTFILVAPTASAQGSTLVVQVGAPLFFLPAAKGAPADGMRFYAPVLSVHQGDILTFTFDGFHTATLLPANTDADTWVAANATGFGKPYSFTIADPDEGAAGAKANPAVLLPSQLDCGSAADPCPYDGTGVVNSGIVDANDVQGTQPYTFSVQINAAVGSSISGLCLIHLGMRVHISVVASTETATTQDEIDAFAATKANHDARAAHKLHLSLLESTANQDGGVVDAYAGFDGPHFSLDHMYPSKITLQKGQEVTWHFDQILFEDHTVTFPSKKALKIASNSVFPPVCDPDGDSGAAPDEPWNPDATTLAEVCAGGVSQIEFDLDPRFGPPAGDGDVTSTKDFESSGVEGANAGVNASFTLRFPTKTDTEPYTFICMIHPFMHGKVVVG